MITTKPYISSSNYIRKMSDFAKRAWCEIWDGLFWRFVNKHEKAFSNIQRMKMVVTQLRRMDRAKLDRHVKTADKYLQDLVR